jgi:hypothetical protein
MANVYDAVYLPSGIPYRLQNPRKLLHAIGADFGAALGTEPGRGKIDIKEVGVDHWLAVNHDRDKLGLMRFPSGHDLEGYDRHNWSVDQKTGVLYGMLKPEAVRHLEEWSKEKNQAFTYVRSSVEPMTIPQQTDQQRPHQEPKQDE